MVSLPQETRQSGDIAVYGSNGRVGEHTIANTLATCLIIGRKGSFGKVNYSQAPAFAIDTTFYIDQRSTNANLRWLYYLLTWIRLDSVSKDSAVPGLDREDAYQEPLPVAPLPEQAAIVRYLDHADRRIRHYIRVKQKLIALLNEEKQAIIHQAVTRGLDPNVQLKPSGVEWLGDVPEHWEVFRLKTVLSRPMRNGLFKRKDAFGTGAPLVNVADVYRHTFQIDPASLERVQATPQEVSTYQVQSGDLFFVRSSLKLEGTGRSAVALSLENDTVFECHLVQGRPDPRQVNARFLALVLNSHSLRNYLVSCANVVTMATIAQDVLKSCPLVLPPLSEQEKLLHWIDTECVQVEAAIEAAQREIGLLREYRTRLIADVVTGKLDVRAAAAALPEEGEELETLEDESTDEAEEGDESIPEGEEIEA